MFGNIALKESKKTKMKTHKQINKCEQWKVYIFNKNGILNQMIFVSFAPLTLAKAPIQNDNTGDGANGVQTNKNVFIFSIRCCPIYGIEGGCVSRGVFISTEWNMN